jgi:ribosomal protein S12 methylthiotransferase
VQLKTRFIDLARALGELAPWVRLHYVYPYPHVDAVIELMAANGVLPYLDVPFQHGSPSVLKRMRRPAHAEDTLARIRAWRRTCPKLTLRSTFIVGFPGETEAEFAQLLAWLEEAQLDRVGCFKYSPVEGAAANALGGHVPPELQEERYARFMERAAVISTRRLKARIGERTRVLVDTVADGVATARSAAEAPEIDGVIRIVGAEQTIARLKAGEKNITSLKAGEWADVEIVAADAYDLTGRLTAP